MTKRKLHKLDPSLETALAIREDDLLEAARLFVRAEREEPAVLVATYQRQVLRKAIQYAAAFRAFASEGMEP